MSRIAEISKAVAAVAAGGAALAAEGLVSSEVGHWIAGVCGAAAIFLATWAAPKNAEPTP